MATSRTRHEDAKARGDGGGAGRFAVTNRNGRKPRKVVVKPRGERKPYTRVKPYVRKSGEVRHVEGFGPRPDKTKGLLIPRPPRRAKLRCHGVPASKSGGHPRIVCERTVLWTYRVGRPVVRCGECRVIAAWRSAFTRENPVSVARVMVRLAEQGVIGTVGGVRERGKR